MIFLLLTSALDTQSSSHASGTFPLGPMIKLARTAIFPGSRGSTRGDVRTNKTDSMVPVINLTISGCEYNRVLHCTSKVSGLR